MNTETAKALDKITDRGLFEQIATSILKIANPNYICLNDTGININGETRKAPIDASGKVFYSDPPHYIYVEYTTTEIKSLKNKWLNEKATKTNPLGDLIKLFNQINETKKDFPDAKFEVILCSNKRKDDEIEKATLIKATGLCIPLSIWWQDNFLHYLDYDSKGQYIREKLLGIKAEKLSEGLLKNICQQNLKDYKKQQDGDISKLENLVDRNILFEIEKQIQDKTKSLLFINGKSGLGKSIISYQILKRYIDDNNNYGIWIDPRKLNDCTRIENLIEATIKEYQPTLVTNSINDVFSLTHDSPLLIIIDDINRVDNSHEILVKIQNLSKLDKDEKPKFKIICPVWPQLLSTEELIEKTNNIKNKWYEITHITFMTEVEATQSIEKIFNKKKIDISFPQIDLVAKNLKNDPYLIGLLEDFELVDIDNVLSLSNNLLENFLIRSIRSTYFDNTDYLETEYLDELLKLSYIMLQNRDWIPSLLKTKQHDKINFAILRPILNLGNLCTCDSNNNLIFRHDRIREYLFIKSLVIRFKNNLEIDEEILTEPYYAEVIAQFIATIKIDDNVIQKIKKFSPVTLIESINNFKSIKDCYFLNDVVKVLEEDYINPKLVGKDINVIGRSLLNINSEWFINLIREKYLNTSIGWVFVHWHLINLKFGDLESGAIYCEHFASYFYYNDYLYTIIKHLKLCYNGDLKNKLKQLLNKNRNNYSIGTLVLLSYLKYEDINEDIYYCWSNSQDKTKTLSIAICAALNCFDQNTPKILNKLMDYYIQLPDEGDRPEFQSTKGKIKTNLATAFSHEVFYKINSKAVEYLINLASQKNLFEEIDLILRYLDLNIVHKFRINYYSKIEKQNNMFIPTISAPWGTRYISKELSLNSINYLKQFWRNESEDKSLREQAFILWLTSTKEKDIPDLKKATNFQLFSKKAIIRRVELNDLSVIPDFIQIMNDDEKNIQIAYKIWSKELIPIITTVREKL